MLKTLDSDATKLEQELEKSKDTLVSQIGEVISSKVQNKAARMKMKGEEDIQAKMKQMIADLEQKIANAKATTS